MMSDILIMRSAQNTKAIVNSIILKIECHVSVIKEALMYFLTTEFGIKA